MKTVMVLIAGAMPECWASTGKAADGDARLVAKYGRTFPAATPKARMVSADCPRRIDARKQRCLPRRRLRKTRNAERRIERPHRRAINRRPSGEGSEPHDPRRGERVFARVVTPDPDAVDEEQQGSHGLTV